MKFFLPPAVTLLLALGCVALRAETAVTTLPPAPPVAAVPEVKTVKLLTIGNSLAEDSTAYLGEMARAGGRELILFRANKAGHSMEQHVSYIKAFEANPEDPVGRAYSGRPDPTTKVAPKFSLREALESEKWDYVTIQQLSSLSFKAESYEPYASTLISYIKQHAPTAKILVLQTWAYRPDNSMFAKGELNSQSMFEGLKLAYSKIAADYNLSTIPCGEAFQAAAAEQRWQNIMQDPDYDYTNPTPGVLPKQAASLYVGYLWRKDPKTGQEKFILDARHASPTGRYLAASVLHNMLFRAEPPADYCPKGVAPEDVPLLRKIAFETVQKNTLGAPAPAPSPSTAAFSPVPHLTKPAAPVAQ